MYEFRNQPSLGTWNGFKNAAGLADWVHNYTDRFVDVADADITLPVVAYGSCTAGTVAEPTDPDAGDEVDPTVAVFLECSVVLSEVMFIHSHLVLKVGQVFRMIMLICIHSACEWRYDYVLCCTFRWRCHVRFHFE